MSSHQRTAILIYLKNRLLRQKALLEIKITYSVSLNDAGNIQLGAPYNRVSNG